MAVRLGDEAPDFTADTTDGELRFHEWKGDSWAVLFSHPKDFTPVCTTELGTVAKLKDEFEKRNTKVIGLSVDPIEDHHEWAKDIEETQGAALNFPMIADPDRVVADLYDMIHPNASNTLTVRSAISPSGPRCWNAWSWHPNVPPTMTGRWRCCRSLWPQPAPIGQPTRSWRSRALVLRLGPPATDWPVRLWPWARPKSPPRWVTIGPRTGCARPRLPGRIWRSNPRGGVGSGVGCCLNR